MFFLIFFLINLLIGGRFLGCGSGKLLSRVISDASLDVLECVNVEFIRSAETKSCSSLVVRLSCIESGRRVNGLRAVLMLLSLCRPSGLLAIDVSVLELLLQNDFMVLHRLGDDTWKLWRANVERFNPFSSTFSVIVAFFCSASSGMEFWLGGRGAARFLRVGAAVTLELQTRWFIVIPDESDEFSEFVELYGDTDDMIVCGLTDNRLSWLLVRYLTNVSSLPFLCANLISFKPTSPMVKLKSNTCVSSAKINGIPID